MPDSALEIVTNFITVAEGFRAAPYQRPGDKPTIGYGTCTYEHGQQVTLQDPPITQDRARAILAFWLGVDMARIQELVSASLNDNQLAALTSFEYNTGALKGSHLLIRLNDKDFAGAMTELMKWTHGRDGQGNLIEIPGLVNRRQSEKDLFLKEQA